MKKSQKAGLLALSLALALAACGGPPRKTSEMIDYEQMRSDVYAETVRERFPDLAHHAGEAYKKAQEALDDGEDDETRHFTRVAAFKWRAALAKSRAQDAADSTLAAENRLKAAEDELKDAQRRHQGAIDALEQAKKIRSLEGQMVMDKKIAAVQTKVKDAVGMDAARYAPNELAKAEASLKVSRDAYNAGKVKEADKLADAALIDADILISLVKPKYDVEKRKRDIDAWMRALLEKSGSVPGAKGKIVQRGFVLTLRNTFAAGKSEISNDQLIAVDRVAELCKEFTEFKLAIEGHTDNVGNKKANLAMSEARAQAVLSYLAAKGVDVSRLSATGKGDTEPVADNRSRKGRDQNRRVEVIFLR